MSTIALKAVIAAGTGTGKSFEAYNLTGNLAVFREVSAAGTPGLLTQKRIEPKPTKDYVGVSRGEVKFTRQVEDAQGISRPVVMTVVTSLPAFMTDAARDAFVTEGLLAAQDPANQAVLARQVVAQS